MPNFSPLVQDFLTSHQRLRYRLFMKNLWSSQVLAISILISALSGCNNKAVKSLELNSAQTTSDVEELQQQVEMLQELVEEQENSWNELLTGTADLSGKIDAIEESLAVLRSSDDTATKQNAETAIKLEQVSAAVRDLYTFVREMRNADQRELVRLQQRQERIAEASRPIMQKIAELTAKREQEMARLVEINRQIEGGFEKTPGISDTANMESAMSLRHLLEERNRVLRQRATAIQHSIDQIDAAIRNERDSLRDIQNAAP